MIVLYYNPQDYKDVGYEELSNLYRHICKIAIKENKDNQNVILMPKHLELRELNNQELVEWYKQLKHTIKTVEKELGDRWVS